MFWILLENIRNPAESDKAGFFQNYHWNKKA